MLNNLFFLVLFGLCWGITIPLMKLAVTAGHHPLGLIFWQMLIAALTSGIYIVVRNIPVQLNWRYLRYYLLIALVGTIIPHTFSLMATSHLPAGIMAITIATVPMISLCVALLFRLESFSWLRFIGVLLGVSALMLIALPKASLPDPAMAPWLLVALLAPLSYAIEGNFVAARAPKNISAIVTLMGASFLGCMVLAPILTVTDNWMSLVTPWDTSHQALIGSSIAHLIAYSGYLWLLSRAGAVFSSQIGYVVTLSGVFSAMVMLNEQYSSLVWFAVVLMLAGVALVRPAKTE